ncbi:hypothetical protein AAE02nite_33610 [Adhaeribacter aerolatus]|uniref:DUF2911 domain-containing protein n=1 Tax=Adhaeribacter aerolatus TaxID=670289 RepID=A0A512B1M2_9BACT|nr:DUF2911 domain-containing protein [Adhaeribacter aerolatus]GEO05697.1 hypothetical protein AAE02nite_33610 [Adhaeribacter aerolatus]
MTNTSVFRLFKTGLLASLVMLCSFVAVAQENKAPASPPATASGKIGAAEVTINYSSPGVKGRTIGKEIAPYGQVWRTGANAATKITFSKDVTVEGQALKAGTYALFTLPSENEWVIIFNKTTDQWGAFKYEQAQDALRVKVKPTTSKENNERFKITVAPKGKNAGVITLLWGNIAVPFNVKTTAGV